MKQPEERESMHLDGNKNSFFKSDTSNNKSEFKTPNWKLLIQQ